MRVRAAGGVVWRAGQGGVPEVLVVHRPKYEDWSKKDLYDKATEVGIEGRSSMSKKQLIAALRNH